MKQKLSSVLIFNLLLLSLWSIKDRASATEQPNKIKFSATTVKQWRSQLNNSLTAITAIRPRKTPQGIEIRVITRDNKVLQGIQSVEGNKLIVDFPNTEIISGAVLQGLPPSSEGVFSYGISTLEDKTTTRITVTGKEGTPTGQIVSEDFGATIDVIPPLTFHGIFFSIKRSLNHRFPKAYFPVIDCH